MNDSAKIMSLTEVFQEYIDRYIEIILRDKQRHVPIDGVLVNVLPGGDNPTLIIQSGRNKIARYRISSNEWSLEHYHLGSATDEIMFKLKHDL